MPIKLFVGNIQCESNDQTEAELRSMFEEYGQVVECDILTGKNYGFVHMATREDAQAAIDGLQGQEFYGSEMNIELSESQGPKAPSRGASRGGGRGARGGRGASRGSGSRYEPYGQNGSAGAGSNDPHALTLARLDRYARGISDPGSRYEPYGRNGSAGAGSNDPHALTLARLDRYARGISDPYNEMIVSRDPYMARAAAALADVYAIEREAAAKGGYGGPPMGRGGFRRPMMRDGAPGRFPRMRGKGGRPAPNQSRV